MAVLAGAAISHSNRSALPFTPLRIMHAGLPHDFPAAAARAAAGGFRHIAISPPWRMGGRGDPYLTSAFTVAAGSVAIRAPGMEEGRIEEGGIETLARISSAAGLGLILDVVVDRLAADAAALAVLGVPFACSPPDVLLDPRRSAGADAAFARGDTPAEALDLAAWWLPLLRKWQRAGAAGFRVLGMERMDPLPLSAFMGALRAGLPDTLLLCWTPGLKSSAVQALRGIGLDGVFASVPWWDWRSDWLWSELANLIEVAPVLGVDAIPPGLSHSGSTVPDRRSTALAAVVGQGWMHVSTGDDAGFDTLAAQLNRLVAQHDVLGLPRVPTLPLGDTGRALAVLRLDGADHRDAGKALLAVINADVSRSVDLQGEALLGRLGGAFERFSDLMDDGREVLSPASRLSLEPGDVRVFGAVARKVRGVGPPTTREAALTAARSARLAIEQITPAVDGGAFPVKATAGEMVSVEADIVFDGHEKIAASVRFCGPDGLWSEVAMQLAGNDRWHARIPIATLGRHTYIVQAWRDRFETFRDELAKKSGAGISVSLELQEGEALVAAACGRCPLVDELAALQRGISSGDQQTKLAAMLSPGAAVIMKEADDRPFMVISAAIPVDAERIEARFSSWYEVFPRSLSDDPGRHGTFADVEKHLPRIASMGFDVLYFPPISPIGEKNRKGRNNSLTPDAGDPGSPYAIGSKDGGHDALHRQLGTLETFAHLRSEAARHGLEIAIDFAIQCSPDHPWLKQHPGWFDWRPDGTIRYAENPPKKYEDIVNVDFYTADAVPDLWIALCDVVLFWAEQGIRLFRVDNPHTKPLPFWQWMIGEVRQRFPDAIFLAEAFTRPKIMYRLAKIGFSQSYTYFTWRNTKRELEAYSSELDIEAPKDFFRPHFFVNTPDINPVFLHGSGRPGFLIRAALATTLSGLWGCYNGFELCEAAAVPGKEEYLDSEKYQLRAWDWDRPGNIVAEITALNRIRKQNPALQTHRNVTFLAAYNDSIVYFEKATPDRSNVILIAISLDPFEAQEAAFEVPLWRWSLPDHSPLQAVDLVDGTDVTWQGKYQHMRLTPERPFRIWRTGALA